jgi:hypothetical protein
MCMDIVVTAHVVLKKEHFTVRGLTGTAHWIGFTGTHWKRGVDRIPIFFRKFDPFRFIVSVRIIDSCKNAGEYPVRPMDIGLNFRVTGMT